MKAIFGTGTLIFSARLSARQRKHVTIQNFTSLERNNVRTQYLHSSIFQDSEHFFLLFFFKHKYRVLASKCSYWVKTVKMLSFELSAAEPESQNHSSCSHYSIQNSVNKLAITVQGILTTKLCTLGCYWKENSGNGVYCGFAIFCCGFTMSAGGVPLDGCPML